eukprot:TRINITY_DN11637_c0_g1_i1.p1 TRINITY_DN11637_c0_g1~~TRINITY_DN11637_c0_g1_i1.p1  ORF type:complete len:556 (+),score=9.37 TRINITY_DN11637_c0_g1_i1:322-1989(+)
MSSKCSLRESPLYSQCHLFPAFCALLSLLLFACQVAPAHCDDLIVPRISFTALHSVTPVTSSAPRPWLPRLPSFHTDSAPDGQCTSTEPVRTADPASASNDGKSMPMGAGTALRSLSGRTRDTSIHSSSTEKSSRGVHKTNPYFMLNQTMQDSGVNSASSVASGRRVSPRALDSSPIYWNGGPIMSRTINVYFIWYGNWAESAKNILRTFVNSIGVRTYPSGQNSVRSWWEILIEYYDSYNYVPQFVRLTGEYNDNYSQGRSLSGSSAVKAVVQRAIGYPGGDPFGVYMVMTASDVTQGDSGGSFCNNYCGWHTYYTSGSSTIKYGFVGYPSTSCGGCRGGHNSVNGDKGADAAVSTFAHELAEAVTDPLINAWQDKKGNENADKCAWMVEDSIWRLQKTSSGGEYNLVGNGNMKFLVQYMWDRTLQTCRLQSRYYWYPISSNVGAYVSFYSSNSYTGWKGDVQAGDPLGNGCANAPSSVGSLTIRWNVNDGKANHLGCGILIVWNQPNCWGNGYFWHVPGGWANFNPTKFDYANTNFVSPSGFNVQSFQCIDVP